MHFDLIFLDQKYLNQDPWLVESLDEEPVGAESQLHMRNVSAKHQHLFLQPLQGEITSKSYPVSLCFSSGFKGEYIYSIIRKEMCRECF